MTQNVASDAGYAGNITALSAATGDAARIARFVREACSYVEGLWGDWRFLWGGIYEGVTVANNKFIPPPDNLYRWDRDRMIIGDSLLYPIQFNDLEWFPNMDTPGIVCNLVIMPDNSLRMYPYPDIDTNYYLSWYKNPMVLVNDLDEPNIPDKFRKVIEAYALWLYAMYDDSAELAAKSEAEYGKWLLLLEADQRPGGLPSNQSYDNHIIISAE
nr:MAG: Tail tubular protein [Bacteriophage sp.]